jgi:hypothetical protein
VCVLLRERLVRGGVGSGNVDARDAPEFDQPVQTTVHGGKSDPGSPFRRLDKNVARSQMVAFSGFAHDLENQRIIFR